MACIIVTIIAPAFVAGAGTPEGLQSCVDRSLAQYVRGPFSFAWWCFSVMWAVDLCATLWMLAAALSTCTVGLAGVSCSLVGDVLLSSTAAGWGCSRAVWWCSFGASREYARAAWAGCLCGCALDHCRRLCSVWLYRYARGLPHGFLRAAGSCRSLTACCLLLVAALHCVSYSCVVLDGTSLELDAPGRLLPWARGRSRFCTAVLRWLVRRLGSAGLVLPAATC